MTFLCTNQTNMQGARLLNGVHEGLAGLGLAEELGGDALAPAGGVGRRDPRNLQRPEEHDRQAGLGALDACQPRQRLLLRHDLRLHG